MFAVASDYSTLIELLVGAIIVSTYFGGKKVPYPDDISIVFTKTWKKLRDINSGHLPSLDDTVFSIDKKEWNKRTEGRIKDTMLIMILYGAFSLFYCGNCNRINSGDVSFTITPYGIIIDSIMIFIYYIYQVGRYEFKYSSQDKWVRNIKMGLSIVAIILSIISYYNDYHTQDKIAHKIATISILLTCTLPMIVLLIYSLRDYRIYRKNSEYVHELSCVIVPIQVIEKNENSTVVEKINEIMNEVKRETDKKMRLYLMKFCLNLADDSVQYIKDIDCNGNKVFYNHNNLKIESFTYEGKKWREKLYLKKIRKSLNNPDFNEGDNNTKEINNHAQLTMKKNEVFDHRINELFEKITKCGINLLKE